MKAKRTKPKTQSIIQKIEVAQIRRTAQDIDSWRSAIKTAESIFFPRRVLLYDLYSEVMLDGHLTAVTEKRKLSVTNTPLHFIGDGKVNEELTAMVSTENFMCLLGHIMDSKIWGHSLIELSF